MKIKNKMINKIFNILIIDIDKEFNNNLDEKFKQLGYCTKQSFNIPTNIELLEEFKDESSLIILTVDRRNESDNKLFKYIKENLKSKIIILSEYEDINSRENYFKQGILDYHLKSNNIKYIVSDIDESLTRLSENVNENILVIDDSKVVCHIIKYLLKSRNYNVITASNARDGIEIFKDYDISLLILDMELPDMKGTEVLDTLRDVYYINNFPTLVLSGSDNPSIVRQALKKGASDFLKKPFNYEEFLLKIDLWIKSSRSQKTIKNQKMQIQDSLHSFEALVNSTIEALFIFEKDICVDTNNEAVMLMGMDTKQELLDKNIFDLFTNVTDEHKEELLDNKTDHFFEDTIVQKNNNIIYVQIKERNIKIRDKSLKIIAVIDITQIKQKEKILNNQSKMASMGEMIGNIAHQWRQPLTAISVAAGGIRLSYELDMNETEETLIELDNIVENTQFLSSTIEDFQNFLKNDRITTAFSIKQTIEKSIAIIHANLESHEINIIKKYNTDIQIEGIQNDLIQVLLNIINNAADILKTQKSMDQKKYIFIDFYKSANKLVLEVQDSAGGVPDNIINKIFEPYFTTKHQSQGTGLGLYMTHQIIVDNMHGEIFVENLEFEYEEKNYCGAKFVIELPLVI